MTDCSWLKDKPIAHRGLHDGNRAVWENTRTAFTLAVAGGHPIECDVHLTSDGQVVVFHDSSLKRLIGKEGLVREMTASQMKAMPIGGTRDCTLSLTDMLDLIDGRVPVVVEFKGDPGHDEGFIEAAARIINSYGGEIAVMSFDHHLIRQFKRLMPNIAAGLTAEGVRDQDMEAHFSMLAYGFDFVSYNVHHLPNRFVTFVREKLQVPVITWTVRSTEDFAKTHMHADQATFEGMDPDRISA